MPLRRLVYIGMLGAILMGAGSVRDDGNQRDRFDTITGVLEELDLTQLRGRIRTDLGKPIFFDIVKPELFNRLTVGERITVQLDAEGRAVKAIDVPVPELPEPLPPVAPQ